MSRNGTAANTTKHRSMLTLVARPQGDAADAEILAIVRASATGRHHAAAHRRALQEKAGLFIDFQHFCRLCIGDLEAAFGEDRNARANATSRMTKNRRRCWLAAFRCYARHAGIEQGVEIVAVDRQGHYACRLIDKAPTDDWQKLVRLAEGFGIDEEALRGCLPAEAAKPARGARERTGADSAATTGRQAARIRAVAPRFDTLRQ